MKKKKMDENNKEIKAMANKMKNIKEGIQELWRDKEEIIREDWRSKIEDTGNQSKE